MQSIITEIQNGCHSSTVGRINPRILQVLLITVVHNPERFHANCSTTFCIILFTENLNNGHGKKRYLLDTCKNRKTKALVATNLNDESNGLKDLNAMYCSAKVLKVSKTSTTIH